MKFMLEGGEHAPKRLKVNVVGQEPIVLLAGKAHQFKSEREYEGYRERMEALVSEGIVKLVSRDYADKKPAPKPAPAKTPPAPDKQAKKPAEPSGEAQKETPPAPSKEGAKETKPAGKDKSAMKVPELRKLLKEMGNETEATAKKAELLAKLASSSK